MVYFVTGVKDVMMVLPVYLLKKFLRFYTKAQNIFLFFLGKSLKFYKERDPCYFGPKIQSRSITTK